MRSTEQKHRPAADYGTQFGLEDMPNYDAYNHKSISDALRQ
jgi:hypothetical protein